MLLTWVRLVTKSALQYQTWKLIGIANDTAAHHAAIHCARQHTTHHTLNACKIQSVLEYTKTSERYKVMSDHATHMYKAD